MRALPDPVWPVVVLALIQVGDGVLCMGPVRFVRECFEGVKFPREWWWVTVPVKFAAAVGLILGVWVPVLGGVTVWALVAYFLVAVLIHVRARDFGRNLFLNAAGMLAICVSVALYSFGP
ncbi:DoxX family protein [Streptomyces niveus]|uniref:DoxX family protein n=1 Tax=Streptomyces niveus TaxID=193462 RepID=UPI00386DF16E|nr:DoxX family protein [Streptomyces niveus]